MHMNDLLTIKLSVPPLRTPLVSRPHVVALLEQGRRRTLTLISASSGSGKTTALSTWLHDTQVQTAWLSLDRYDNHLQRFWRLVLAALERLLPGRFQHVQDMLKPARPRRTPSIEAVLTALTNSLADLEDDVILVLDDYHEIHSDAIHTSLTFLLNHLPQQIHVFILTRSKSPFSLPLLQVSNQLGEIHSGDLRFSLEDAEHFLNTMMGRDLTFDDIAMLHECTVGQVAALQLAGFVLQGYLDSMGFIDAFADTPLPAETYLIAAVLEDLPGDILQFLRSTSLLDYLCAPLCQAVTEYRDSQEILAFLEQSNLFLVALDKQQTWYQYHPLLADYLRTRMRQNPSDFVSVLHRRAAHWYRMHGYHEQATHHLLQI
jgi:LuxR family maltose regulon positive regulatory protein